MILAEWLGSQTASTTQLQKQIMTEGSKSPLKIRSRTREFAVELGL
jgi:hypothetical protein